MAKRPFGPSATPSNSTIILFYSTPVLSSSISETSLNNLFFVILCTFLKQRGLIIDNEDEALGLYHFDEELRMLVFAAIQQIEVTVRTRLIRLFSERHGAFWFMDATLADSNTMYHSNLNKLQEEINRSEDEFILEHFRKYDTPSKWVKVP
jgi:hypothetical protein